MLSCTGNCIYKNYCCVFYNSDWQQQKATDCISLKKASTQGKLDRENHI